MTRATTTARPARAGLRRAAVIATAGLLVSGAAAQDPRDPEPDEQTERWEREDRRYFERRVRPKPADPTPTAPAAPVTPETVRGEAIEELWELADSLIRDRNYRSVDTGTVVLRTDDPRLDVRACADLVAAFRAWFDGFWEGRVELRPADEPSRLYLFFSFYKYNKLWSGSERFPEFRPAGHYRGYFDTIVAHSDGTSPGALPELLVHETAHQLLTRRVPGFGVGADPWLVEGGATYFANTLAGSGGAFRTGVVGGKSGSIFKNGDRPAAIGPGQELKLARERLRGDPTAALAALFVPERFYDSSDARGNYALAWVLVHYLFHGDDGTHADAFASFLRAAQETGDTGQDALLEALALTDDELAKRVVRHAKGMRVRSSR